MSANSAAPAVMITGASTGIGAACALDLDQRGFRVFAGVRRESDGQRLQAQASPRLTPVEIDITIDETIRAAAAQIAAAVGEQGLAGLVNNAGVAYIGPVELVPLERIRRQFEINVFGHVAVTQALLPLLRAGRGRIVNISSLAGIIAIPFFGPYTASKHALEAFSDCLRNELVKWGIKVAIIEPGGVKTPIWQKARESNEAVLDETLSAAAKLYGDEIVALRKSAAAVEQDGMPVERVVEAVRHALTARRPKTRYPLGHRAVAARRFSKWLPDRLRDWLLRRRMGLK